MTAHAHCCMLCVCVCMCVCVQVSHTLCPETLQHLYVVAQVDVTADILAQHKLALLQVRGDSADRGAGGRRLDASWDST